MSDDITTQTHDETAYAAPPEPGPAEGTPDEVGPAAEVVPGVGPVPEPEDEGFRDEQIKKEEERRERVARENIERSAKMKDYLSGGAARQDDEGDEATSAP